MLKVVGASLVQTRLASYILGGLAICGLGVIIFSGRMGSKTYNDGIYSATVYWKNSGYRIEFWGQGNSLDDIPSGSARAYYQPDHDKTGWSKLEIETNANDPDSVQAYSAGLLEGSLSWQLIYWHWQNTIQDICEDQEEQCEELREYIRTNSETMRTKALKMSDFDSYWHQVRLYYAQIDGIEMGWRYAVKRSRQSYEISTEDFLWMNHASDIFSLAKKHNLTFDNIETEPNLSSAFFKLTNFSGDAAVHVLHNSAGLYRSMLRTVKKYNFNFHETGSSENFVPGTTITFTGFPGVISSLDDFYLINSNQEEVSHNLVVTGTKIAYLKIELWDSNKFNPQEQVFTSIRAMVANRLAQNGRLWSRYFSQSNSGTDNKQWVVLDKSKLNFEARRKSRRSDGLLWVIEQIPGVIFGADMSHMFHKYRYWASFGLPVFDDIREAIKFVDNSYGKGILYSYTESPKAVLFAQCRSNCNNQETILNIARQGINPPKNEVGARADLYSENSIPFGVIDSKIFTATSNKTVDFKIMLGPVFTSEEDIKNNEVYKESNEYDNIAPFQWSSSKFKDISHVGQPDVFNLETFRPVWSWN